HGPGQCLRAAWNVARVAAIPRGRDCPLREPGATRARRLYDGWRARKHGRKFRRRRGSTRSSAATVSERRILAVYALRGAVQPRLSFASQSQVDQNPLAAAPEGLLSRGSAERYSAAAGPPGAGRGLAGRIFADRGLGGAARRRQRFSG